MLSCSSFKNKQAKKLFQQLVANCLTNHCELRNEASLSRVLLWICIKFWNRPVVSWANIKLRLRIGIFLNAALKGKCWVCLIFSLNPCIWSSNGTVYTTRVIALGTFFFPLYSYRAPDEMRILLVLTVVSPARDLSDFSGIFNCCKSSLSVQCFCSWMFW